MAFAPQPESRTKPKLPEYSPVLAPRTVRMGLHAWGGGLTPLTPYIHLRVFSNASLLYLFEPMQLIFLYESDKHFFRLGKFSLSMSDDDLACKCFL